MTENANERFERLAAAFHKATGFLAPGKDDPLATENQRTARRLLWDAFMDGVKYEASRAAPREPGEAELRDAITSMTVLEDELDYPRVTATFCYGDEADGIEFTGTDALDCCRQFIAWYRASRPDAGDGTGET
jgi:hypothetical protein